MVDKEQSSETEEKGATPVEGLVMAKASSRGFIGAARRDLTETEAASAAGVRWLTYDAERLEQECSSLRSELEELRTAYDALRDQHSDQRVELEKIKGASTISLQNEYLSYLCFSAGSMGIGAVPGYLELPATRWFAITVGLGALMLVLGGLILRKWK